MSVYLAGPISNLSFEGATDWRNDVKERLKKVGIEAFSPMRGKDYLAGIKKLAADCDVYENLNVLSSNRGIITRDRWDATRCSLLLVNFLGATKVSIGTVMEIAWADLYRIPIVCAIEEEGNIHDHGMIKEAIGFRVDKLDMALELIYAILST